MATKNYTITVKTNSTCPQRSTVTSLLESGKASFSTVIGEAPLRGFYPLYIDSVDSKNLYGFIQSISDEDGTPVDKASYEDLLANSTVKLTEVSHGSANIILGVLTVDDVKAADAVGCCNISEALQMVIDDKIAEGIITPDEMDKRLQVMFDNRVQQALIIKIVKGYRKYNKSVHQPSCIYVDPFLGEKGKTEGIIAEGLRSAALHMPTICEGEKSVGKNVFMETIAWLCGMPLYMIGFSRNMNPGSIYGEKSTDNSASERLKELEDGAIAKVMLSSPKVPVSSLSSAIKKAAEFELAAAQAASVNIITDASELYDWMSDGGLMVWNEMNMAESNFFSSFANPLTDGTGFLFFPGRGEVKMHRDCVLFGTQNADYEGVQVQNEATMSRFNTLHFRQPEKVIGQFMAATEAALKRDGCDYKLDAKFFNQAQAFYSQAMSSVRSGVISNAVLNIRGFVRALTAVAESEGFCTLKRWISICVIDTCPPDEREALQSVLNSVVTL